ncbi:MAG: variant-type mycofactocin precursor [Syntrophorhabdales bacterium]|jgi:mycofactocin precursor
MKDKDQKEMQVREEKQIAADRMDILEEIEVEDLTVDGICGVY